MPVAPSMPDVGGSPTVRDLLFGAGAGLVGVAGLVLLYRGLAQGRASVVAPLSAVGACILQVTWGLGSGETRHTLLRCGLRPVQSAWQPNAQRRAARGFVQHAYGDQVQP